MEEKKPSPHAKLLCEKLRSKGINAQTEYPDGFKTIDIAILDAKLYIEVDDLNHFVNPKQIISDFNRVHFSDVNGFSTFFVTNQILDRFLDDVVNALETVVTLRHGKINKQN